MHDPAPFSSHLNAEDVDLIFWRTTALNLPAEGVARHFPDERSCLRRLSLIRWKEGEVPACERCGCARSTWVRTRELFQCANRACRRQFSPTAGTWLHGRKKPLRTWFLCAEALIRDKAFSTPGYGISTADLGETLGLHYSRAWEMRKLVTADLAPSGEGLLRKSVCVRVFPLPAGMTLYSVEHLAWIMQVNLGWLNKPDSQST